MSSVPRGDSDRQPPNEPSDKIIIRAIVRDDGDYFVMPVKPLRDERLSYAARGVLLYIKSLQNRPAKFNTDDLIRPGYSKKKIERIIDELVAAGYLRRLSDDAEEGGAK